MDDHRIESCVAGCQGAELGELLRSAAAAALAAGRLIRELYDQPHQVRLKGDIDLVTEADIAAEQKILAILGREHPGIAVLAEEESGGLVRQTAGPAWIIDPLDGTTNFAHGFPWFAVSIGYVENNIPQAGVIYHPMLDELFCAAAGSGAWLNGQPIRVSSRPTLISALVATGFPYAINQQAEQVVAALATVLTRCRGIRRAGAAALDLAYVACGRLDGFFEIGLKPWDTAAGQILLTEAGGTLTDYGGQGFSPFFPELVASNNRIHAELVTLLRPFHQPRPVPSKKVLFLCTGNACRSQMAEALVNHDFAGRIEAFSAGTDPKGVSSLALQVLDEIGIDHRAATSKHLDTLAAERFDYVITLCDQANEACPVFFGGVRRLHMGFPDPPHTSVASEENLAIYRRVRDLIRARLSEFFRQELGEPLSPG